MSADRTTELEIDGEGVVTAVYADDLLPLLTALGQVHVERASWVEYDNAHSTWGVWTQAGKDTGERFATRAEALAWEVVHISTLLDSPGRGRSNDHGDDLGEYLGQARAGLHLRPRG